MAMPPRNNRKEPSSSSSAADNFSRAPRTKPTTFPPGYKFVPTDEDLIVHYLKPFLRSNKNPPPNVPIHRVNIYESNPEQLSREYEQGNDKEWFFITERTKMHEGGKIKHSRCDNGGFWKGRSALGEFKTREGVAFWRRVLEHYVGKKQNGVKSEWLMYEYLTESSPRDKSNGDNKRVDYALCKIYMTSRGIKRKAEEEENEKKKKKEEEEGGEASQEVDQPCNPAVQQTHLPPQTCPFSSEDPSQEVDQPCNPAVQQTHLPPQSCCPFSSEEFHELFDFHNFPDDVDGFFTGCMDITQLDEDTESNNSCDLKNW